jgi:hypothetical protein
MQGRVAHIRPRQIRAAEDRIGQIYLRKGAVYQIRIGQIDARQIRCCGK